LLPEKERRDILSKTQGLPFLIAAFLKSLLAADVIQNQEEHWILDRRLYKQKQIPTDIDDSLSIAMKDLSDDQEALLRVLALHGQALKSEELQPLVRGIIEDPSQALTGLLQKTILAYRDDGTVTFVHPLYAQLIIENIPSDVMKSYSAFLADHLVSEGSNDSLRVAQLYISAERVEEALEYGFHAVDRMYSSYMLYDCLKLLLDLKDLATRKGSKSQLLGVLERLAPIEHKTGLPREAIEDYRSLVDAAQSDSHKAHFYMQLANVHFDLLGNIEESRGLLKKALRSAERTGNAELMAAVYHGLGGLNHEKSIHYYHKAAALSKTSNINLYLTSLAILAYKYQLSGLGEPP
jgi:tetratricopeptide (TPR) repeat protein